MGGCNSTFGRMIQATSLSSGKNCGHSKYGLINATENLVVMSIINSINDCNSSATIEQLLAIGCNPDISEFKIAKQCVDTNDEFIPNCSSDTIPVTVYEENKNCANCLQGIFDSIAYQGQLERHVWIRDKDKSQVRSDINDVVKKMSENIKGCGMTSCKACTLSNISQKNIITLNQDCFNQTKLKSSVQENLSGLLQEQLASNKDVISAISEALQSNDIQKISTKLSTSITTNINDSFYSSLESKITQSQIISSNYCNESLLNGDCPNNNSSNINGLTQYSLTSIIAQQVQENNIIQNAKLDSLFNDIIAILDKNNTLDSLGDIVFESTITFVSAFTSVIGKIMIIMGIILGTIVLVLICLGIYRLVKRVKQKRILKTNNLKNNKRNG